MIEAEQLPGLWSTSVSEGEVLSGSGARALDPCSGLTRDTIKPTIASSGRSYLAPQMLTLGFKNRKA